MHSKSLRDHSQGAQSNILRSPFDTTIIRPIQLGILSERLLRETSLNANPPDVSAHYFNKVLGHPGWLERTTSIVHRL